MVSDQPAPPAPPEADGQWIRDALERFEQPLVQYARRLVGDLDRAQDVVQDTFLKLCQQREADLEGRVNVWLFSVCRNRALDVRRKERPMNPITAEHAQRPGGESDPARALEEKDHLSHVFELLSALPEKQREVLMLKFQSGLSYKEISRVTEQTVGNVGYLIHVGLKAIRARLGDALLEGTQS